MKPRSKSTRLQTIRRFGRLAKATLAAYGMSDAHLQFLALAGNALFRVFESAPRYGAKAGSPYIAGQYLLRIHDSNEQVTDSIRLEMEWLSAMRRDLQLPVPEPVPSKDGRLLVQVSVPELAEVHDCTLLRWLRGRHIGKRVRPFHFQSQGRLMAKLHNHAAKWSPPKGLTKRRFDYQGLFKDDAGAGLTNAAAWPLLPDRYRQPFEAVSRRVKRVMAEWGKDPSVYGLIHGDCGVDANVLFWKGKAHLIDFDGSGFGYYLYDLAIALEHCWEEKAYPEYLDALLKGYSEFRSLPDEHPRHLDLLRAAFYVYMGLWTAAMDHTFPDSPNKAARHQKWLEYGSRFIWRYLDGC